MSSSIFKEVYRGQGIYWHNSRWQYGYGDETNAWSDTLQSERRRIDDQIACGPPRQLHEQWWDSLSADERHAIRRQANDSRDDFESVSQWGYDNAH